MNSNSSPNFEKVKIVLQDDTRLARIGTQASDAFEALHGEVKRNFPALANKAYQVAYKDEEDDLITIGSSDDVREAFAIAKQMQRILKVFVRVDQDEEMEADTAHQEMNVDATEDKQTGTEVSESNDENEEELNWRVLVEDLKKDEELRDDLVAALRDVLTNVKSGQDLATAIDNSFQAHQKIANHVVVQQLLIPALPGLVPQLSMALPMVTVLDENVVAEWLKQILSELLEVEIEADVNHAHPMPPFLHMIRSRLAGFLSDEETPYGAPFMTPFGGFCGPFRGHGPHGPAAWGFGRGRGGRHHGHGRGRGRRCGRFGKSPGRCGGRRHAPGFGHGKEHHGYRLDVVKEDVTLADCALVEPNQALIKTWAVHNTGSKPIPQGCSLIYRGHPLNPMVDGASFAIAPLDVGEHGEISAMVVAPTTPGRYQSGWRISLPDGSLVGPRLVVRVQVVGEGSRTELNCECGSPLDATTPVEAYGTLDAQVSCDDCGRDVEPDELLWHCSSGKTEAHSQGFDLCDGCGDSKLKRSEKQAKKEAKQAAKQAKFEAKQAMKQAKAAKANANADPSDDRDFKRNKKLAKKAAKLERLEEKEAKLRQQLAAIQLDLESAKQEPSLSPSSSDFEVIDGQGDDDDDAVVVEAPVEAPVDAPVVRTDSEMAEESSVSRDPPAGFPYPEQLEAIQGMGIFDDRTAELLVRHNGDLQQVMEALFQVSNE